ncbi:MAG: hypothetical protein QOH06_1080 [Acidobacteriota bacterium]|jgi:hypothetical protein|nr:hypothetical protein [Acidobacteriota bacterium]
MIREPFPEPTEIDDPVRSRTLFGRLALPGGSQHPAWVELSHRERAPSPITCRVRYPEPLPERHVVPYGENRELWFNLETPYTGSLRLHLLGPGTYGSHDAKLSCGTFDLLDPQPTVPAGSRVRVSAYLTSTGFLLYRTNRQVNFDGTIERVGQEWPLLSWERDGAQHWLQVGHDTRTVMDGSHPGLLLSQRPLLRVEFEQTSDQSLTGLLDQVVASLELPLVLFSLLSRRTIEWFDLSVHVATPGGEWIEARRRSDPPFFEPTGRDERPLFREHELVDGRFDEMLRGLENCIGQTDIVRSVRYLLGSYRNDTVDTNFLLAVSALETLVNALEKTSPMGDHLGIDWKVLVRALNRVARCYCRRRGLSTSVSDMLQSKIAELRRPSFTSKAKHHLQRLGVDTSGLWLNYRTAVDHFSDGLATAYKTRSALVHNTSINDLGRLISDLARVQCLLERAVLRVLGDYRPHISEALVAARYRSKRSPSGL